MNDKYVEYGEYMGNPTIILRDNANDNKPSEFGLVKANLYLSHLKKIKEFVNEESSEPITLMKDEKDRFPVTLSLRRARLILRYLNEIREFVSEGRVPKLDSVNFDHLFGIAAFGEVGAEDKAKLVALKAYILGAVPCDTDEKMAFIKIADEANRKISIEPHMDSLYKKQFFLIVLSELTRCDDPMFYRNKAHIVSSHIEELHIPNPFSHYLKIINYLTKIVKAADFGDITVNPNTKIEKHLEAIAKNVLDLSVYALSKSIQKYLFYYTLGDISIRI